MSDETEACYYVLDVRSVVGNCACWWRPDGKGYTCDIDDAGLYTLAYAKGLRETDIPIHRDVAQRLVISHVRLDDLRQAGLLDAYEAARTKQEHDGNRETIDAIRRELEDCEDAEDAVLSIAERLGVNMDVRRG